MGRSALTFASQHGHSDIVAILADSGAQLNLKTHVCALKAFTLHCIILPLYVWDCHKGFFPNSYIFCFCFAVLLCYTTSVVHLVCT